MTGTTTTLTTKQQLDRYLTVVHPIRSLTIRTRRNAVVALVFLWTVVIAANSPMLQHFSVRWLSDRVHTVLCIKVFFS